MTSRRKGEGCSESRLRSFLNNDLPGIECDRLADHLDHCEGCRCSLDRLSSGSRIFSELRELATELGLNATVPGQSLGAVGSVRQTSLRVDELIALDFLDPATSPKSLGRLGSYDVIEVLGHGAFGVVLKAFDPTLSRFVAIKVLNAQLASSASARSRFDREAKAAAAVVHENVIAIHAVDAWRGLPYLVMPWIAGRSLQERVDQDGPLAVKQVLRIGMQAARGLAAAHEQGIVHRDVKPSNILLENQVERVKLSDFGLARAVDDASRTQSGLIAGTPQYMSPEQACGDAVDHRSDLFSLGSVLYFMCTGHPPFRASSTPAVLRRVCDDLPRPVRELNPDIPAWMAQIIDRLLAKEANGRYESAAEVAEILGHHLAEIQATGSSTPLTTRERASARKIPRLRTVAVASFVPFILVGASMFAAPIRPGGLGFFASEEAAQEPNPAGVEQPPDRGFLSRFKGGIANRGDVIEGSGVSVSKTWDIKDFTSVSVDSTFQATIKQGEAFKVTTTCDDNIIEYIRIMKENKTLKVGLEPNRNFRLKEPLRAEIVLPHLEGLDAGGASSVMLEGIRSEAEMTLGLHGASKAFGKLEGQRVAINLSGASRLTLEGSARFVKLTSSGAGKVDLANFATDRGEVELSGASRASITVRSEQPFKAMCSGASRLKGSVEASDLSLKLDGASDATLEGNAGVGRLSADGASTLKLDKMSFSEADVSLSGASRATVDARDRLTYRLASGTHLDYRDDPATLSGTKSKSASLRRMP